MIANRVRARQKGVKGYISAIRPGWLGNPFPIIEYSLDDSLKLYEEYLRDKLKDNKFAERFDSLVGKDIGCTCPLDQSCHVDIIIKILSKRHEKQIDLRDFEEDLQLQDLLQDFEEDLQLQNLAKGTIRNYLLAIKKLFKSKETKKSYLNKNRNNRMLIHAYRKYLHYQQKIGQITSEDLLSQLNTFKPPKKRGSTQNGIWIPRNQWEDIIAIGPTRCAKMGIWLGFQFGLRVGEIIHLRVEDIDLINNKVLIQSRPGWNPKHFRERFIPITKDQHEILDRWINERPNLDHLYLIYTARNQQVTARSFQRWCQGTLVKPHDLRRSFAKVLYYESKKNLKLVQLTLGHANISTTSSYLGLEEEEIQEEYIKAMG